MIVIDCVLISLNVLKFVESGAVSLSQDPLQSLDVNFYYFYMFSGIIIVQRSVEKNRQNEGGTVEEFRALF